MLSWIWTLMWKEKIRGEEIMINTALEFKKGSVMWTHKMKAFTTKQIG